MQILDTPPASALAIQLIDCGLVSARHYDRSKCALEDILTGVRSPTWLGEDAYGRPVAKITMRVDLHGSGGDEYKTQFIEWIPRAGEDATAFCHRVLAVMVEIAGTYVGRRNVVTLEFDAYTQRELDVLDQAIYAGWTVAPA